MIFDVDVIREFRSALYSAVYLIDQTVIEEKFRIGILRLWLIEKLQ
jgi:hypothetical protein